MKFSSFRPFCRPSTLGLLALPMLLAACGGGGDSGPQAITLDFAAKAGTQVAKCGTMLTGLGSGAVSAELHDLRFYVSNVALISDTGESVPVTLTVNDWQNSQVALIDLEDASGACAAAGTAATNVAVKGTVPAGNYKGVKFTVGVPSALNHTDYAVATKPMDVKALAWSWQAGRKFAQIEVNPTGGVARPAPAAAGTTFYTHLGSTGCTGNPVTGETVSCERSNRMDVTLASFNVSSQKLVLDLAELFKGTNLNADLGGAVGCMSGSTDPECPAVFKALQIDLATGKSINGGASQTVFRAEAK